LDLLRWKWTKIDLPSSVGWVVKNSGVNAFSPPLVGVILRLSFGCVHSVELVLFVIEHPAIVFHFLLLLLLAFLLATLLAMLLANAF
jgi:hypothetical protein